MSDEDRIRELAEDMVRVGEAPNLVAAVGRLREALETPLPDPLAHPCTACSAPIGAPCHDRAFVPCEPHMGRRRLAGLT